jgi:hypothetical protein
MYNPWLSANFRHLQRWDGKIACPLTRQSHPDSAADMHGTAGRIAVARPGRADAHDL